MRERAVQVGDVELRIAEAGEGGRPFLLLHGFTGSKEDFTRDGGWLDRLADLGWHAVAPDHRGHGLSSKPPSEDDYSFEILSRDALALADALGWNEPFVLLGHSMGGVVAQVLVDAAPERVSALVLMDTGFGALSGLDPDVARKTGEIAKARGMRFLSELQKERGGALDTPASRRLKSDPAYQAFEDGKLLASSPFMYAAMIAAFAAPQDRLEALAKVSVPTLVIVGEQDRPFIKASERMAAAIPGAQLAVIADAGHSPQFENPDAWWDALSGFLSSVAVDA